MSTLLSDLKEGDIFCIPGDCVKHYVTEVYEGVALFEIRESVSHVKGEVETGTGIGRLYLPSYLFWHITIEDGVLSREEYTEEEKLEANVKIFPLFVDKVCGGE